MDIKQAKLWTVWLNYDVESATAEEANVYTIDLKTNRFRREDNRNVQSKNKQRRKGNRHWSDAFIRKFEIKHNRYAFCRVALVGEKAISLPVQSCSVGIASCYELANQPFRRSHFHCSETALFKPLWCIIRLIAMLNAFWTAVPCHLECCSSWIGTLFQLSWNRIPT